MSERASAEVRTVGELLRRQRGERYLNLPPEDFDAAERVLAIILGGGRGLLDARVIPDYPESHGDTPDGGTHWVPPAIVPRKRWEAFDAALADAFSEVRSEALQHGTGLPTTDAAVYRREVGPYIAAALLSSVQVARELNDIRIVFDGPPGAQNGRFVEVETGDGRSIRAGTWHKRKDGLWELRMGPVAFLQSEPDYPDYKKNAEDG